MDKTGLLVTVEEAGRLVGLSRATMWRYIASGELPSARFGRARRVLTVDLERWAESHREETY